MNDYIDGTNCAKDVENELIRIILGDKRTVEIRKSRKENPEHWKKVDKLVKKAEKQIGLK